MPSDSIKGVANSFTSTSLTLFFLFLVSLGLHNITCAAEERSERSAYLVKSVLTIARHLGNNNNLSSVSQSRIELCGTDVRGDGDGERFAYVEGNDAVEGKISSLATASSGMTLQMSIANQDASDSVKRSRRRRREIAPSS